MFWRKAGSVRSPSHLFVSHSVVVACRFPLSLSFLCAVILWKNTFRGFGKYGHEFLNLFSSLVSPAEIVPWKIVCGENPWPKKKYKNISVNIFRQSGNGRILSIVFAPDSEPPPWSPLVCLVQHNIRPECVHSSMATQIFLLSSFSLFLFFALFSFPIFSLSFFFLFLFVKQNKGERRR